MFTRLFFACALLIAIFAVVHGNPMPEPRVDWAGRTSSFSKPQVQAAAVEDPGNRNYTNHGVTYTNTSASLLFAPCIFFLFELCLTPVSSRWSRRSVRPWVCSVLRHRTTEEPYFASSPSSQ